MQEPTDFNRFGLSPRAMPTPVEGTRSEGYFNNLGRNIMNKAIGR